MKYQNWLTDWLELYVKPTTKTRTYQKYKRQIEIHILPSLGNYKLEELSAIVLQRFVVKLTEKGLTANTANFIITLLKTSLKRAVQIGVIDKEFSSAIVRPKAKEKQVHCFSKDEQRKIERYVFEKNNPSLIGIVLTLYTGLRIGELLALTWDDVDLCNGIITVSKSCHDSWDNGKYVKIIDTPKTDCSSRLIPIPKQLLPYLKTTKKVTKCNYIICGKTCCGAEVRCYQNTFDLLQKRLNLPHRGFHSLRHTFATRALECGMDVKTLSEILGHKNPTVTLKRYAHSMLEHKTEMMNKIGKLLL